MLYSRDEHNLVNQLHFRNIEKRKGAIVTPSLGLATVRVRVLGASQASQRTHTLSGG